MSNSTDLANPATADSASGGTPGERPKRYRFGFILNTTIGNLTRYRNLRKFADRVTDVECYWVPISAYPPPAVVRTFRILSDVWLARGWIFRQLLPALRRVRSFDAVMLHLLEAEAAVMLRALLLPSPLIISSTDEAPIVDESTYPLYEFQKRKSPRRRALRLRFDRWRARQTDLFIPFTQWAGRLYEAGCGVPPDKVIPIHVGLDLETWTLPAPRTRHPSQRTKILFVGGEFERKGGDLLMRVFEKHFASVAELHLVTRPLDERLPMHVHLHAGFEPNDPALVRLYCDCDLLVVPTTADLAPWVYLEAMAVECPPIGTDVGAIPEMIDDGVTGFIVPPGDEAALVDRISRLLSDPALRLAMGRRGREKVERQYDAAKNVPRILEVMKAAVDERRSAPGSRGGRGR